MKHILPMLVCLIFTTPLTATLGQAGELYRWVDQSGKVHYGDAPPPDVTDVESKRFAASNVSDENLPYATRKARENFPVVLHASHDCGEPCVEARSLLDKRGIPFSEKLLKTKDDIDAFKRLTGSDMVPTLAVGRIYLKGFQSQRWHSELDIAGYPKSAPYRAPNNQPAAPVENPEQTESIAPP